MALWKATRMANMLVDKRQILSTFKEGNMKTEFKNGSTIESIDTTSVEDTVRG